MNKELLFRNIIYGDSNYNAYHYPAPKQFPFETKEDNSILFLKYDLISTSSIYIEKQLTNDKNKFSGIEMKWNPVANAIGYYVYKGANENSLEKTFVTKSNKFTDTSIKNNNNYFYKIVPIFKKES